MSANQRELTPTHNGRSEAQRQGSAAMAHVMQAWEALTDEQRLTWDVAGKQRRMKGITYFKHVNLRRLSRGDDLAAAPPQLQLHDPRPLLRDLHLRNRDGRITLELHFRRPPDFPRTIWASLPCNRGLKKPHRCPRLGWLPAPKGRWCDITKLYFRKHGETLNQKSLQLVGKRIFVRLRPEDDDGPDLFEQVKAVVPAPEVKMDKKATISSKGHRRVIEAPSNGHRSITLATRRQ